MDTIENIGQPVNIHSLNYEELRAHKEEVNTLLRQLEASVLEELEAKAASLGLSLTKAQPPKQKRKRRTKEEIERDNA